MILVVVIQKPKGGGLAGGIGISSQVLGVQKTTDVVERSTWVLAGTIGVLILAGHLLIGGGQATATVQEPTRLKQSLENLPATRTVPTQQAPAAQQQTQPAAQQTQPAQQGQAQPAATLAETAPKK